jgi:hypothetical protein
VRRSENNAGAFFSRLIRMDLEWQRSQKTSNEHFLFLNTSVSPRALARNQWVHILKYLAGKSNGVVMFHVWSNMLVCIYHSFAYYTQNNNHSVWCCFFFYFYSRELYKTQLQPLPRPKRHKSLSFPNMLEQFLRQTTQTSTHKYTWASFAKSPKCCTIFFFFFLRLCFMLKHRYS